jgi:hypothetical protein
MNDAEAMGATTQGGSASATQVLPTGAESAQARSADVRAYVTAVRSWLSDLPSDEVEDLTAGMEADLDERAAETGDRLGALLGEPEAYAAELRAAAGLAPRVVPVVGAGAAGPGLVEALVTLLRARADGILTRWPWLRELRPTWWLARGAALGWLLSMWTGTGRTVLLPLLGAVLSFWLGLTMRRRDPLRPAAWTSLAVANVIAALAVLPMVSTYTQSYLGSDNEYLSEGYAPYPESITANGEEVRNLFAYDASGNRLDGVRLFDQAGRPVVIDTNLLFDGSFEDIPTRPDDGMPDVAHDVFPLRWAGHDAWADPRMPWTPPLVLAPVPGVTPSTAVSPTPSPTSTASPSASPSATSTESGTPSPSPTVTTP